jgi:hypothetical protein
MSSPNSPNKTKISSPFRRFLTTITGKSGKGKSPDGSSSAWSKARSSKPQSFQLKPKSKSLFAKKQKLHLPVNNSASSLSKGTHSMKSKSHRSFKAMIIALLIAISSGYAVYRSLFTPRVQVQHVARQWLDNSAGKSVTASPRRVVHSGHRSRPVRTYSCHIPRYTAKKSKLARHSKKHRGGKRHVAQQGGRGFYRTSHFRSN